MNKALVIAYALTLLFGFASVYSLAFPTGPMRTHSMNALFFQIFFLIGFGFIIGNETFAHTHQEKTKNAKD